MSEILKNVLAQISQTESEFNKQLAQVSTPDELEQVRISFMSRKGKVQSLFSSIGKVDAADRPQVGAALNQLKAAVQKGLDEHANSFENRKSDISSFDPTLPGRKPAVGSIHPLMRVMDQIKSIFTEMGFRVEIGPEIETDFYNFEALNLPPNHPARDMQDTFYLEDDLLLRTHTSPVQIHTMEEQQPPIRMIAPGRVFRKDTPDATHTPIFHQVEGLVVDKGVSFADLMGVVQAFAQKMFGKGVKVRFRPSFFPFTEPSAEYDFSCVFCGGSGCRVCKQTGWIEISGAGMVDPAVFNFVNYDPDLYSGYAFGMGIERIAMLLYGVNDIRTFYENDIRFLEQF